MAVDGGRARRLLGVAGSPVDLGFNRCRGYDDRDARQLFDHDRLFHERR
jgi:hypothetical protein